MMYLTAAIPEPLKGKQLWLLMLTMLSVLNLQAQRQNDHWYLGNRAGIEFSSGQPVSVTDGSMLSIESCATVSDAVSGKLLFYSNGLNVWNANHKLMPNGSGLLGGAFTSATQGVVIAPHPGKAGIFFLFTADETQGGGLNGLRYSMIDMSLDSGRGDVMSSAKNVLIQGNVTERIAVTAQRGGRGLWILVHEGNNNVFKAYALTDKGLNTTPVVSSTGSVHVSSTAPIGDQTMGAMKFSPRGDRLAVALFTANLIELFSFDPCKGTLSAPQSIRTLDHPYGLEFSPDNSKLYYAMYYYPGFEGAVYQTDIRPGISPLLPLLVGISSSINTPSTGALQLGPDGRIYMAVNSESWISAISRPNVAGAACGFIDKYLPLQRAGLFPQPSLLGLPYPVVYPDSAAAGVFDISISDTCINAPVIFGISGDRLAGSIRWELIKDGNKLDSGTQREFRVLLKSPGPYLVRAVIEPDCRPDTLTGVFMIKDCNPQAKPCNLTMPNVFTPNEDTYNETFVIDADCTPDAFDLRIYNRWGELLFRSHDIRNSWNGKVNNDGPECPEGSYFFSLDVILPGKPARNIAGAVSLIRGR